MLFKNKKVQSIIRVSLKQLTQRIDTFHPIGAPIRNPCRIKCNNRRQAICNGTVSMSNPSSLPVVPVMDTNLNAIKVSLSPVTMWHSL